MSCDSVLGNLRNVCTVLHTQWVLKRYYYFRLPLQISNGIENVKKMVSRSIDFSQENSSILRVVFPCVLGPVLGFPSC